MPSHPLKIVFMGSPDFSVPTLQALLKSHHSLVGVYTQPPKKSGRGYILQPTPIHKFAESHGLKVYAPPSLKPPEVQKTLAELRPDLVVVIAYGLILPKPILSIPSYGCINIHASLLPRWRGAAPIQRAILAGDTETGITIMQMDEGLDTGDILLEEAISLGEYTTAPELHDKLASLGAELMIRALDKLVQGTLTAKKQSQEGATYAHKVTHEEGRIDWYNSAKEIERQVRALNPWPGTWFEYKKRRIRVYKVQEMEGALNAKPGTILTEELEVACGTGALKLLEIQQESGKRMTAQDYLRGHPIPVGTCLDEN